MVDIPREPQPTAKVLFFDILICIIALFNKESSNIRSNLKPESRSLELARVQLSMKG